MKMTSTAVARTAGHANPNTRFWLLSAQTNNNNKGYLRTRTFGVCTVLQLHVLAMWFGLLHNDLRK